MASGGLSSIQFGGQSSMPSSGRATMSVDTGGTYSNIGSRLGMSQTPAGGGGGFNVGGMMSVGGGGALARTR